MKCVKCAAELPDSAKFCHLCGKKQQPEPRKHRKRANGSGTIFKQPGNRAKPWAAKRCGIYIGAFQTYSDAQKALERITDADITDRFNMTFAQIYEAWKPEHERDTGASGMANYAGAYKHCEPLHSRKFRSLRTSDLQAIIITMEKKGLAKSTCEKVVQLFSQLYQWAIRENISVTNYAKYLNIAAKQKKTRRPFTDAEIKKIQESEHFAAPIAQLLIATGCRPNELFKVSVGDCHDLYFVSGSKTEAGKNRVIAVCESGMAAYQALLHRARESGCALLIDAYEGNHTAQNFAKRDFKELMKSLGITDMTPYNCRHTFATMAVKAGVKPELLQEMLGHASYSTTIDNYTHLDLADILTESKKIVVVSKLSAQQNSTKEIA